MLAGEMFYQVVYTDSTAAIQWIGKKWGNDENFHVLAGDSSPNDILCCKSLFNDMR